MTPPLRADRKIALALEQHLFMCPQPEQAALLESITTLSDDIKNLGRVTALEILWAVGRKMNDERHLGR